MTKGKGELGPEPPPAPSVQVMDGCNFSLLAPPFSILFDSKHKHLKQKKGVLIIPSIGNDNMNTSLGIKGSHENNGNNELCVTAKVETQLILF